MATLTFRLGQGSLTDMTSVDWSELLGFSSVTRSANLLRIHEGTTHYAVFCGSNLTYPGVGPGGLKSGTVTALKLAPAGHVILDVTRLQVDGGALASAYAASNDAKVSHLLLSGNDLLRATDLAETLGLPH